MKTFPRYGFLSMTHEARTDFSMLLGLIFLLIVGAGAWYVDALLARGTMNREAAETNAPTIGRQRCRTPTNFIGHLQLLG